MKHMGRGSAGQGKLRRVHGNQMRRLRLEREGLRQGNRSRGESKGVVECGIQDRVAGCRDVGLETGTRVRVGRTIAERKQRQARKTGTA